MIPAPTSGSNSAHSNGNPDFPVAAIAVVSILSGLAAILVAYKVSSGRIGVPLALSKTEIPQRPSLADLRVVVQKIQQA